MPLVGHRELPSGRATLLRGAALSRRDGPVATMPNIVLVACNDWGHSRFDAAGSTVTLEAPRGHILVFGSEPVLALESGGPGEAMALAIADDVRQAVASDLGVPAVARLAGLAPAAPDPVVGAIAARLRSAVLRRSGLSALEGDRLLYRLYARLLETSFDGKPRGRGDGELDRRRLRRVVAFVEANLAAELSIADLAATAALSPFHFLRCFRRATGMTPHRFVLSRRLERARADLEAGDPVAVVAGRYGFSETWYFRSVYRKHHGPLLGPAPPDAYPARGAVHRG